MKSKKNLIILAIVIAISLIGVTYAFFDYYAIGANQKITAGKVNLILNDGTTTINRTNIFPETKEKARKRTDNFITFTVSGINTTEDEDIYYEIMLNEGDSETGMTRFNPEDLVFDLVELNEDGTDGDYVVDAESFSDFNAKRIWVETIKRNTATEVNKTYKLRMWLSEDVLISDSASAADYPSTGYENHYASIKVSVYGDFVYKDISTPASCFTYNTVETKVATYDYPIGVILDTSEEKVEKCKTFMMDYPSGDVSVDQDGFQKFCEGTGTADLDDLGIITLEEFALQLMNFGNSEEDIILMTGVVTDIQKETRYYELNTIEKSVNACKEYMLSIPSNGRDYSDAGDGFQTFCEGTGTLEGNSIFDNVSNNYFYITEINHFVENNILIQVENIPSPTIEITDYDETCGTEVVIPAYIEGLSVTRIADGYSDLSAFGYKNITSIKFPNTLKYIGEYAFTNNNLTEVVIPDSVTTIEYEAFKQNNISTIEIGTGIKNIAESSFYKNPFVTVNVKSNPSLGSLSFNMFDGDSNIFQSFQYGGTCEELNQYEHVFYGGFAPQTIITSDSNSCEYTKYNVF